MRVTDYIVLVACDSMTLMDKVKQHLEGGWSLQGGVSYSSSESDSFQYDGFAQAMVKGETK